VIVSTVLLLSLVKAGYLIYLSDSKPVGFEKVKQRECSDLKKNNPKLKELY
jgi:hypothetical protein